MKMNLYIIKFHNTKRKFRQNKNSCNHLEWDIEVTMVTIKMNTTIAKIVKLVKMVKIVKIVNIIFEKLKDIYIKKIYLYM